MTATNNNSQPNEQSLTMWRLASKLGPLTEDNPLYEVLDHREEEKDAKKLALGGLAVIIAVIAVSIIAGLVLHGNPVSEVALLVVGGAVGGLITFVGASKFAHYRYREYVYQNRQLNPDQIREILTNIKKLQLDQDMKGRRLDLQHEYGLKKPDDHSVD